MKTPELSKRDVYSDKIEVTVTNIKKYSKGTKFKVYVSGNLIKTVSRESIINDNNYFAIYDNEKYLKPSTTYTIKVKAVKGDAVSSTKTIKIKTASSTYYNIDKGTAVYTLTDGKMKKSSTTTARQSATAKLANAKGTLIAGKSADDYAKKYIKITSGTYKNKYVKIGDCINRITEKTAKQRIVTDYAKSMAGGSYVYGGSSFRATDCSGLTMLSYKQIGVTLTHNAASQASVGTKASMSSLQPGDIIICNGYGHAAMYVGSGKIVHAVNSSTGIKMESVSRLQYFGGINAVRRII